jgi:hypothetical protein
MPGLEPGIHGFKNVDGGTSPAMTPREEVRRN